MNVASPNFRRLKGVVRGAVQGVGFRPFVYRLATELKLSGWVLNSSQGVFIEVEGEPEALEHFHQQFRGSKPPLAVIQSAEFSWLDAIGYEGFEIRHSEESGQKNTLILPDVAMCPDCLRDILDPANRRFRYPFTNCTNCGPRFSIIEALPYDRPNTSMKIFPMCEECAREYSDPQDRRFDAQPTACARCGPHLELWDKDGAVLAVHDDALRQAADLIRHGRIVALKGLGGFQLLCDARREETVARLRTGKRREEKPFALMFPALSAVQAVCAVSDKEVALLQSPASPIVLLRRLGKSEALAPSLAPGNPAFGVMLPSTPLHYLLLAELKFPVVATSGNLSAEPICTDEYEALDRLRGIAEFFLVHDRPIVRHVDDSIVRCVHGRELVLRRARGYAPLPIHLPAPVPSILAVGAHLKNTVALSVGAEVFVSQYIGDLTTAQAHAAFGKATADLPRLYDVALEVVAADRHPEYLSTQYAAVLAVPAVTVQHHWAHVLSCMAENEIEGPVLGVSWDGTGLGLDGTIWGGEFLQSHGDFTTFERVAHLRSFRLPGGDAAIKQPSRVALGLLFEMWGANALNRNDLAPVHSLGQQDRVLLAHMLSKGLHAPRTSSAGRLFDAAASLLDLRQRVSFEGQAAMELEFAIQPHIEAFYPFEIQLGSPSVIDWRPMMELLIQDSKRGERRGFMAAKFHNTLVEMIVGVAQKVDEAKVVLTGGCFQNQYLVERCIDRLAQEGFRPYWHQRVPPNDGGIALGQVVGAAAAIRAGLIQHKEGALAA